MLTKTTVSAIRALLYISQADPPLPLSPRRIGEALGESPTYLAKVARDLVKAGILRAQRGVNGGVQLNQPPTDITLRAIVEACQGTIVSDFCHRQSDPNLTCSYHQAATELHQAIVGVLSRWTLERLASKRRPSGSFSEAPCLMLGEARGLGPVAKPPGAD